MVYCRPAVGRGGVKKASRMPLQGRAGRESSAPEWLKRQDGRRS